MRKTAMQELKDKLQDAIEQCDEDLKLNDSIELKNQLIGYQNALRNTVMDIEVQMIQTEKQQIVEAWQDGGWDTHQCPVKVKTGTEYYNNEFQK